MVSKNAFNTGVTYIKGTFQSIDQTFAENPILNLLIPFIGIPRLIIANWIGYHSLFSEVWSSITAGASGLWTSITTLFAPIGQWFSSRMSEVKTAFSGGIAGMSASIINWTPFGLFYAAFAKVLSWFGIELPAKFSGFGSMIIGGLVKGIESGFGKLKSLWSDNQQLDAWLYA